jgi:hypothetical protein
MSRTIEISDETYECIKSQLVDNEKVDISSYDDLVGKCFFFRTITYHLVGKVIKRFGSFLQLQEASWIPDSSRFMQFIKEGKLNEVEPVGNAFLNLSSVVDFFPWKHLLPKEQK